MTQRWNFYAARVPLRVTLTIRFARPPTSRVGALVQEVRNPFSSRLSIAEDIALVEHTLPVDFLISLRIEAP